MPPSAHQYMFSMRKMAGYSGSILYNWQLTALSALLSLTILLANGRGSAAIMAVADSDLDNKVALLSWS